MENHGHNHSILGLFSYSVTLLSGSFAVLGVQSVQPYFTLGASIVAIVSGVFAIRYYHFATKRAKK
jgi:hypothetical protein